METFLQLWKLKQSDDLVSDIWMPLKINKFWPDVSEDGTVNEEPSLRYWIHPKLSDKILGNTLNHSQTNIPKISVSDTHSIKQ